MATGNRAQTRKPPAKRPPAGGKGKAPPRKAVRRPARAGNARKADPAGGKLPPLPLLFAWIAVVACLIAVIYFSGTGGRKLEPRGVAERNLIMTDQPGAAPGSVGTHTRKAQPDPAEREPRKTVSGQAGTRSEQAQQSSGRTVRQRATAAPTETSTEKVPVAGESLAPASVAGFSKQNKPGSGEHAPGPELPAGPVIPPRPKFSSKDLTRDPVPSPSNLALHRPSPAPAPAPAPPAISPVIARVAIVIDDFGPDLEVARKFMELPFPVTFSVLPHQAHSTEIARAAHSHGNEVMLHLPMEPHGFPKMHPGKGALLLSMSDDSIRRSLGSALDALPHFSGVNNHMGSRMTEDDKRMNTILEEVHRRGLFFLDSCTSPKSRAWLIARKKDIPTRRRDVFLDHNPSLKFIRKQISVLIRKARVEGTALAIGHPYKSTLEALREASVQFRLNEIKVVPASQLMSTPAAARGHAARDG